MLKEYIYPNKTIKPRLSKIHDDVAVSAMTGKKIVYCLWNEEDAVLHIFWEEELVAKDKTELDKIVAEESKCLEAR